jgi:hypothetical protein
MKADRSAACAVSRRDGIEALPGDGDSRERSLPDLAAADP